MKLNVLLAKTDALATSFRSMLEDYIKFFKQNQGAFKGEKKTYTAKAGMIDIPGERSNKLVVTTVNEKLDWLMQGSADYLDALFSQEKTNASGTAKAELKVGEYNFGTLTSLELLKLKSLLESGGFISLHESIPVRNDDEQWEETTSEMYKGRAIFESELQKGVRKTTTKENYILTDPNLESLKGGNYTPQVAVKDTIVDLGEYTHQRFSGEWSHRQRAEVLRKRSQLHTAVIEALKVANEVESVPSELNSKVLFDYLYT